MAALIFLFRLALKLIFAPVILILALFVWFFTWLVCVSGAVLGIVHRWKALSSTWCWRFWPVHSGCRRLPFGC